MSKSDRTEAQRIGAEASGGGTEGGRRGAQATGRVGAGEAALRVSATACAAGPLGRAREPQASASHVSGGRTDDPAKEAQALCFQ
jgi:hypothetical protein